MTDKIEDKDSKCMARGSEVHVGGWDFDVDVVLWDKARGVCGSGYLSIVSLGN